MPEDAMGVEMRATTTTSSGKIIYYHEFYVPQTERALVTQSTVWNV